MTPLTQTVLKLEMGGTKHSDISLVDGGGRMVDSDISQVDGGGGGGRMVEKIE
jgi:hypothetical protein